MGYGSRVLLIAPPTRKKKSKKYGYLRIHTTKKNLWKNLPGYVRVWPQPLLTEFNFKIRWEKFKQRGYGSAAPLIYSTSSLRPFRVWGVQFMEKKEKKMIKDAMASQETAINMIKIGEVLF